MRLGAKFLLGLGTAATTNLITLSRGNNTKYNSYWHMVDLHDSAQTIEYVRNVIISTLADPLKELGASTIAKGLTGQAEHLAEQASGKFTRTVLKWVTEKRIELPASIVLGSLVEVPKKLWERQHEEQEKRENKKEPLSSNVA